MGIGIHIDADNHIHIDIDMKRFIIGISSCIYGGWEVPQSAVCKLENQENWWYNPVWVQSPGNHGAIWISSDLSPGTRNTDIGR